MIMAFTKSQTENMSRDEPVEQLLKLSVFHQNFQISLKNSMILCQNTMTNIQNCRCQETAILISYNK